MNEELTNPTDNVHIDQISESEQVTNVNETLIIQENNNEPQIESNNSDGINSEELLNEPPDVTEHDLLNKNIVETPEVTENDNIEQEKFEAPINEIALKKQRTEFENLQSQILEFENNLASITDYRNARKNIVSINEFLGSLFLISIAEKDELNKKIQNIFEVISEKQDKIKEENNKIYEDNFNTIKPIIDKGIEEALANASFKFAKKSLIELQKKIKEYQLKASDRDKLFEEIQTTFDKINEKEASERESYEMECSENYLNFKPKVYDAVEKSKASKNFTEIRQGLIALQNQLKELKLSKSNRDELFGLIRNSFEELNTRQDANKENFLKLSAENFEKAKVLTDEAIAFSVDPANLKNARNKLIETQAILKDMVLTKDHRDEFFGKIREIFTSLNEHFDEDREDFEAEALTNFAKLEIKVNEVLSNIEYSEDFREIREGLINVQDEIKILKLKRNHKNDLLLRIRKGFEVFDAKRNEYFDRRKSDKLKKLENIKEGLLSKNSKMAELLESEKAQLQSLNEKLSSDENNQDLIKQVKSLTDKVNFKESTIQSNEERLKDIELELKKINK